MDLRQYLKENGISQGEFSSHLGMRQSTVSDYVTRKASPSLENALKIHYATRQMVALEDLTKKKIQD